MKPVRAAAVPLLLAALLAAARWLAACGPQYTEALFQDPGILDVDRAELARGRYGFLRAGLPWEDLVLVYRALQGMAPPGQPEPEGPPPVSAEARWQAARARVMGPGKAPVVAKDLETAEFVTVPHIGDDALVRAALRLDALAAAHGPAARDWVRAQDRVFASTPAAPSLPDPVAQPPWLARERAYQIAAAHFYAGHWEAARRAFLELAAVPDHPYRAWGRYLAARCWFRQGQAGDAGAAQGCCRQAQALLQDLLKDPSCAPLHGSARDYLELVRYRTEPLALLGELLERLERPEADPARDGPKVRDAIRILGGQGWKTGPRKGREAPRRIAPPGTGLALWLGAMAGNVPWETDGEAALARWRQVGGAAWMVAALSRAERDGPVLETLKAAARAVPPGSPLAPTLRWHLLRLELGRLQGAALAGRLEQALRDEALPPWAANALRQRIQALARDLSGWFAGAPRMITATRLLDSGQGFQAQAGSAFETFDPETARALGEQLPLARVLPLLQEGLTAQRPAQELAKAAWTRAVLLEAWDPARSLVPFLPASLRPGAGRALEGTDPPRLRFQAALCFLDWPGLRPAVEAGLGRQLVWNPDAGGDPLGRFDALRDNWWCAGPVQAGPPTLVVPGLDEGERQTAREERDRIGRIPAAQIWFGRAILAYARAHPLDERVPEALHRFVRSTRSPLCPKPAMTALGRDAFRLLHRRYPGSPWTRRTPWYF